MHRIQKNRLLAVFFGLPDDLPDTQTCFELALPAIAARAGMPFGPRLG